MVCQLAPGRLVALADLPAQLPATTHGAQRAPTWPTLPASPTTGTSPLRSLCVFLYLNDEPFSTFPADLPNSSTDFYEVMDMLDKRLNDKGKNWRHVLKSLKVLDYCLHEGSELVVTWARKNIYIIKTLREFYYVDESGKDVGAASKPSTTFPSYQRPQLLKVW